jgi:hypothetical protein
MSCWVVILKNRINGKVRKMPFPLTIDELDVKNMARKECTDYEYVLNIRESDPDELFQNMQSPYNIIRK